MSVNFARISRKTRPLKDEARQVIINQIIKEGFKQRTVRILTLSGVWWHFEKKCRKQFRKYRKGASITSCEKDRLLFDGAVIRMPKGKRGVRISYMQELEKCCVVSNRKDVIIVNYDVTMFMEATERKFNVVWLDFCGPISRSVRRSIKAAGRVLDKHSLLVLTVLGAREEKQYSEIVQQHQEGREGVIMDMVTTLLGEEVQLVNCVRYMDSAPMIQMMFRKQSAMEQVEAPGVK